jgi:LPS-assembly lipoprotein
MRQELGNIQVSAIEDRIGREVRNNLINRLTPFGAAEEPQYRLDVALEQLTTPLAIQLDDRITRFNLTLSASFSLVDLESGTAVYADNVRAVGSYNVVDSEYATVVSEQDAGERAAREISNEIEALLVVFFRR